MLSGVLPGNYSLIIINVDKLQASVFVGHWSDQIWQSQLSVQSSTTSTCLDHPLGRFCPNPTAETKSLYLRPATELIKGRAGREAERAQIGQTNRLQWAHRRRLVESELEIWRHKSWYHKSFRFYYSTPVARSELLLTCWWARWRSLACLTVWLSLQDFVACS